MPTEMPYGPFNPRYDPSDSWEITDKGRGILETLSQSNIASWMDNRVLSPFEKGMVFAWEYLNRLDQGEDSPDIIRYIMDKGYKTQRDKSFIRGMFDSLVEQSLVEKIDTVESLPDAFKDFKKYE